MKFSYIRLSCPSDPMNTNNKNFFSLYEAYHNQTHFNCTLTNIPQHLDDLETTDINFIHLGGDQANKSRYFRGSGINLNYNGWYGIFCDGTANIDLKEIQGTFYPFTNFIHKEHLIKFPQFINNLGLWSKGDQTQAGLHKLNEDQGLGFIEFLKIKGITGIAETATNNLNFKNKLYLGKTNFRNVNPNLVAPEPIPPSTANKKLDVDEFEKSLIISGLHFPTNFLIRFVSSLCTKPFVLLTGLSGSGKTKLAISFAKWICHKNINNFQILKEALRSESMKSNYKICHVSEKTVELINTRGPSGGIIPLPTKAIYETYEGLISGKINEDDDPKEVIREKIGVDSVYQKHIFGHYPEFHKIAVAMSKVNKEVDSETLKQYEVISVGADWTNREHLLGYINALTNTEYIKPENGALDLLIRAVENPELPFFLILDEMNLSHVERYFSDFLSTMESGENFSLHTGGIDNVPPNIPLPKNLFMIGTVNIDETTYMFSPKVLDRANVLEFRVTKESMEEYFINSNELDMESLQGVGASMAESFLATAKEEGLRDETVKDDLMPFFNELEKAGAEFGFRTASEMCRFVKICTELAAGEMTRDEVIDAAVMQKLLPKLHGSRKKLEPILNELIKLCKDEMNDTKYELTIEKLERMLKRVTENGFTSYAEA